MISIAVPTSAPEQQLSRVNVVDLMRAICIVAPRRCEVRQAAIPVPGPKQVRVRIEGCGICGSSLPIWQGRQWFTYPQEPGAPGHEGWGVVDQVGSEVTGLNVGDRVAMLSYQAHADYDLADAEAVVRLPADFPAAAFPGEALGCAMNVMRRSDIRTGQTVAIVGIGFLGAVLTQLAVAAGAKVIAVSRRPFARRIAEHSGAFATVAFDGIAETAEQVKQLAGPNGCDRVIEVAGAQEALDLASELTAVRGRLIIAGYHQDGPRSVNVQQWNWRGLDVINAHEREATAYVEGMRLALQAVLAGHIDLNSLITHIIPLGELDRAFELMEERPDGFLKAVVLNQPNDQPSAQREHARTLRGTVRPRIGFVGAGWIGRKRLEALAKADIATIACVADDDACACETARQVAPDARAYSSLQHMLRCEPELNGVVIATPSAMHAAQAIEALNHGLAVFCQKPLATSADQTQRVIDAAREADRLVDVDFSYRQLAGIKAIRELILGGALGELYAIDLVFHNAYGPDKPWYYDRDQSGGGCVMDLGSHLIDLAFWVSGVEEVENVKSFLYAGGEPIRDSSTQIEDYAVATLSLKPGITVRLACSWRLHAGREACISADFHGSRGGASLQNIDGSFYDFIAYRHQGTRRQILALPPDKWFGRSIIAWAERLAHDEGRSPFDPASESFIKVAEVIDRMYQSDANDSPSNL